MKLSRIATVAAAVGMLWFAWWLLLPSRNSHGNPDMESLLTSCETNEAVFARLYEGNGGATSSFWYTVTLEGGSLGNEKQVFFAYAEPSIERLDCEGSDIIVGGEGFREVLPSSTFAALRNKPIEFWRGERNASTTQPKTVFSSLLAAVAIVVATVLLLRLLAAFKQDRKRNTG